MAIRGKYDSVTDYNMAIIKEQYFKDNPKAKLAKVEVINGHGWYFNMVGKEFEIWNFPDKRYSLLFGENTYFVHAYKENWSFLVRESNIKFI